MNEIYLVTQLVGDGYYTYDVPHSWFRTLEEAVNSMRSLGFGSKVMCMHHGLPKGECVAEIKRESESRTVKRTEDYEEERTVEKVVVSGDVVHNTIISEWK